MAGTSATDIGTRIELVGHVEPRNWRQPRLARFWIEGTLPDGSKFATGDRTKKKAWKRMMDALRWSMDGKPFHVVVWWEAI